ncbi:MAG: chromo domain-containing protein [Hydrogenophaga sp.]
MYSYSKSSDEMFKIGDRVLLSTLNLRNMVGKARKLLPRYVGPFRIEAHIGEEAVKLTLPLSMSRIHPVFHVSLLRPYLGNIGHLPPTELGWLDDSPQYEVERIVNHRHVRAGKATEYLVKWKGYDDSDNSWEPANQLGNASDCVNLYKAQNGLL